jgi:hypothetical protein
MPVPTLPGTGQGYINGDPTHDEIASYITDMLVELRDMAKSGGMGSLGTLIERAEEAARKECGGYRPHKVS